MRKGSSNLELGTSYSLVVFSRFQCFEVSMVCRLGVKTLSHCLSYSSFCCFFSISKSRYFYLSLLVFIFIYIFLYITISVMWNEPTKFYAEVSCLGVELVINHHPREGFEPWATGLDPKYCLRKDFKAKVFLKSKCPAWWMRFIFQPLSDIW